MYVTCTWHIVKISPNIFYILECDSFAMQTQTNKTKQKTNKQTNKQMVDIKEFRCPRFLYFQHEARCS